MQIIPDPEKLQSACIPPEKLQSLFGTVMLAAASIDCGLVLDPEAGHAEMGESLAGNLAVARAINPGMAEMYRIALSDYMRFCRLYIARSLPDDPAFGRLALKAVGRAVRQAYVGQKREMADPGKLLKRMCEL